jgi:hypothetical protein
MIRARRNAKVPAMAGQRINPKLKQEDHKFQLKEFLEIMERTQCARA